MGRLAIVWEGETVGFMEEPMPDMWYLEGRWVPSENPKSKEFLRATRGLVAKKNLPGGSDLWVELVEDGGRPLPATVISPPGETIFVRRMIDAKPRPKWLRLWRKLTRG